MSNYLYIEMIKNSFYTLASGNVLNENFNNIRFKIDTGCTYSTIPLSKLCLFDKDSSLELKRQDILNNVRSMTSYGVETGGTFHKTPITFEEKMNCSALKFKHSLTNFKLGGYSLPNCSIYINYDRQGNILIGMDILSKFDIHMGVSLKTGKETLIAVLKEQVDRSDYNKALYEHFNIVESNSVLAESFRKIFK